MYTEQVLELHRGQGMEIYWRDNYTCPTEDEYKKMTIRSNKTTIYYNFKIDCKKIIIFFIIIV